MSISHPVKCYSDEWKRTDPDFIVFLPPAQASEYSDNVHFLVTVTPKGDLLGSWTQAIYESASNSRFVCARSSDGGQTWSEMQEIDGPELRGQCAFYGFPVVSDSGRIYYFYGKQLDGYPGGSGLNLANHLMCRVSDDDGRTWSPPGEILYRRTRYDSTDPNDPTWWVIWQKPIRDSQGRWLVSYSHWTHPTKRVHPKLDEVRCEFIRFDNLNEGPEPEGVRMTFLPEDEEGVVVPHVADVAASHSMEASIVLLPDGRVFAVMRTTMGSLWYSVSEDDGVSWRATQPLRYQDGRERVLHPQSPGPLFALKDGRYLLKYHNNDGSMSGGTRPRPNKLTRRTAFIAVGEYRPQAEQPIWFSRPKKLADTDGVPAGTEGRCECCCYSSLTEHRGQRVLWYPDRKHFLLGKAITDEWLADRVVPI